MKKIRQIPLILGWLILLSVLCVSCATPEASVTVRSARIVSSYGIGGGVTVKHDGYEIIEIVLDCTAVELQLDTTEKSGTDEFRQAAYKAVNSGVMVTLNGEKLDHPHGYWPKKATKTKVEGMTLFYLVAVDADLSGLTFQLDGKALGDPSVQIVQRIEIQTE